MGPSNIVLRCLTGFLVGVGMTVAGLWAGPGHASGPNDRQVLALYDGRTAQAPDQTRLHRLAEMPLNHLGYVLTYHDLATGLPAETSAGRIVTWFTDNVPSDSAYATWLAAQLDRGARVVILGAPGMQAPAPVLQRLGVEVTGAVAVTREARVLWQDDALLGFERDLGPVLPSFPIIETRSDGVQSHLAVGLPDGRVSAVINSGPAGIWVPEGYVVHDAQEAGYQWLVDPFTLFRQGFGDVGPVPVPDVTTMAGRRLYFSHIDGDGWTNLSELHDPAGRARTAAEVVRDTLITPYPDLPVSVGVIAGDMDPTLGATDETREVARSLLALPQVEIAVHSYTHPYDWTYFEDYDHADERARVAQVAPDTSAPPTSPPWRQLASGLANWLDLQGRGQAPAYAEAASVHKRAYFARPFSLSEEVSGAVEVIAALAPDGKKPDLYLWSGDTRPFEQAIAATRQAGLRNMNGGNGRFDALFPSITNLAPIARQVGAERQILAPAASESFYTAQWTGAFAGQALLAQTLDRTEAPRRLLPFNLYYHMFSGEKRASVAALRGLLARAADGTHLAITASHYAAIADGFYATRIRRLGDASWDVSDRGALQTLRIDAPGDLRVDPLASHGVLGARIINDALYVALDPAVPVARLVLASRPPFAPMLIESGWRFSGLQRRACGFSVDGEGYGPGSMTWSGLPDGTLSVEARRGGELLWTGPAVVEGGLARFTLPVRAQGPVSLTVRCGEDAG